MFVYIEFDQIDLLVQFFLLIFLDLVETWFYFQKFQYSPIRFNSILFHFVPLFVLSRSYGMHT